MKEPLLQPFQLGSLSLPNRVVMTTMKLGYGTQINERHVAFYVRRAEGHAGLMTTEPMYVQPNGRELPGQLGIHTQRTVRSLRQLTDAVHAAGGLIMAHLNHAGRAANPKLVPARELVSASDVFCPANQVTPRPLSRAELAQVVTTFGQAAGRMREADFDAIEIPFSHGYLIHQFLSPHTNHREDEYGGTLENRLRFGGEVIAAVRQQVGRDTPIVVRMNANDYVEGGLTIAQSIEIARFLKERGVDALSITSGTMCESVPFCLYPNGPHPRSGRLAGDRGRPDPLPPGGAGGAASRAGRSDRVRPAFPVRPGLGTQDRGRRRGGNLIVRGVSSGLLGSIAPWGEHTLYVQPPYRPRSRGPSHAYLAPSGNPGSRRWSGRAGSRYHSSPTRA
jgi:2,4-dienoyl-CoA reductase-like NADH-dependent reductase (Old Yellow Enzyme family)